MNNDIVVIDIILMSSDESVISSLDVLPICDAILELTKTLKRLSKSLWNASFRVVSTISSSTKIKNIQASFLDFLRCSISYDVDLSPLRKAEL